MNQAWQTKLEQDGAHLAGEEIIDFGKASAELEAARSATVVVPLIHVGAIRAAGPDAGEFLHKLLTNDVQKLVADRAQYNSLCSAKGRMLASFLTWREGDDFFLQMSRDIQAGIQRKLSMYILRSKVQLVDASEELILLGLAGKDTEASLGALDAVAPAEPMTVAHFAGGSIIRLGPQRFCLAVRADAVEVVWSTLRRQMQAAGTAVWRWLEITAGIPQITLPVQEVFVPQMANFELIGGVSFQKGCYPGQEIVARTQYLGKLKRRMYLAHADVGAAPVTGAQLFSPGLPDQSCGTILSAARAPDGGFDVLAVLQMSSAEAGDVHLDSLDGPHLQFKPLPYAVT